MLRSTALTAILYIAIACQTAHGNIMGFGEGPDFTLDSIITPAWSINNGTLTLTTLGVAFQSDSAISHTHQSTGSFTASFTYQAPVSADGMTFVIQDDPAGLAALGGAGSRLGYARAPGDPSQIVNSVGLELDLCNLQLS